MILWLNLFLITVADILFQICWRNTYFEIYVFIAKIEVIY